MNRSCFTAVLLLTFASADSLAQSSGDEPDTSAVDPDEAAAIEFITEIRAAAPPAPPPPAIRFSDSTGESAGPARTLEELTEMIRNGDSDPGVVNRPGVGSGGDPDVEDEPSPAPAPPPEPAAQPDP
jgi:hypothetical protein